MKTISRNAGENVSRTLPVHTRAVRQASLADILRSDRRDPGNLSFSGPSAHPYVSFRDGAENDFRQTPGVVQGYHLQGETPGFFLAQEERKTASGSSTFLSPDGKKANLRVRGAAVLRVADTGEMAVEDGGSSREAKLFYGTAAVQAESNSVLKEIRSPIRLGMNASARIPVADSSGKQHVLSALYPIDVAAKKIGDEVTTPERCNEAAPYILNTGGSHSLQPRLKGWARELKGGSPGLLSDRTNNIYQQILQYFSLLKEKDELNALLASAGIWEKYNPWRLLGSTSYDRKVARLATVDEQINRPERIEPDDDLSVGQVEEYGRLLAEPVGRRLIRGAGINEFAVPELGEMLSIRSLAPEEDIRQLADPNQVAVVDRRTGETIENPFPYHFASVVAKSGSDYMTMENYARREGGISERDPRAFFQMYGPDNQSFHAESQADYPNAMTFVYGRDQSKATGPEVEYDADSPQFERMQSEYAAKMRQLAVGI